MDTATATFKKDISLDAPWSLVEAFASQHRENPKDADRGAEMIAEALQTHGIPVTMHRPNLFLSLPGEASVKAGGMVFRAKPPAFCARRLLQSPIVLSGSREPGHQDSRH